MPTKPRRKILYGYPTAGHPHFMFPKNAALHFRAIRTGEPVHIAESRNMIPHCRNLLATTAIKGDYDYLLMHDDDLEVEPHFFGGTIDYFMDCLEKNDKDVCGIGAVYLQAGPPWPTVRIHNPKKDKWTVDEDGNPVPPVYSFVVKGFRPELMEFDMVATGFLLLRVSALKDIYEKEGGLPFQQAAIYRPDGDLGLLSDDVDFCYRAKRAGYRFLADPRIRTTHWKEFGPLGWNLEAWEASKLGDIPDGGELAEHKGLTYFDALTE
jgi:GT2 family glycosyltransferase